MQEVAVLHGIQESLSPAKVNVNNKKVHRVGHGNPDLEMRELPRYQVGCGQWTHAE